ncbi:SDR family NAD(P)-dependent oxidoreductase [Pseudomonas sp. CR3202]|uniref:SDR family NAD(P)-dependent oxidoreductase n=1 Tax=Pseudomonas sp. CR3202 TaxID=3351532 RepID=UPI003BF083F8
MNISQAQDSWLDLAGAVCVVTGAAGGIGARIATALVRQGARVALLDLDLDKCRDLAGELSRETGEAIPAIACNIADPASVQSAAAEVEARYGRCDVLVNNASVLRPAALEEVSLEQWNQVLSVNLNGYLLCSQAFGRSMLAQGAGRIVHVASIASHYPQTWSGAYSAAKSAVSMLSRQLAAEWGSRGVRSNAICPGLIRTPLSAAFYADARVEQARKAMTASGRIGEPTDIANAVLFLASPRSDYVNGAEITVDGGLESMLMALIPRPGYESPVSHV